MNHRGEISAKERFVPLPPRNHGERISVPSFEAQTRDAKRICTSFLDTGRTYVWTHATVSVWELQPRMLLSVERACSREPNTAFTGKNFL